MLVWLLAAQKPIDKQARSVERKVCFISDASSSVEEVGRHLYPKADSHPPHTHTAGESF